MEDDGEGAGGLGGFGAMNGPLDEFADAVGRGLADFVGPAGPLLEDALGVGVVDGLSEGGAVRCEASIKPVEISPLDNVTTVDGSPTTPRTTETVAIPIVVAMVVTASHPTIRAGRDSMTQSSVTITKFGAKTRLRRAQAPPPTREPLARLPTPGTDEG